MSHTNHTKGFTAVFCKSEAISAHAGYKFLAMENLHGQLVSTPNLSMLRNQDERRQSMQIGRFLVFDETLALLSEILP